MPKKNLKHPIPLSELCAKMEGQLLGNPDTPVWGLCPLDSPAKDCLTFIRGSHLSKSISKLEDTGLAGLIIEQSASWEGQTTLNLIRVPDPLAAITKLMPLFFEPYNPPRGISRWAQIDEEAQIGKDVTIGPFSWIGAHAVVADNVTIYAGVSIYPGAQIGPRSVLYAGVSVREDCRIGADCILHDGVVIGADGFGYISDTRGICKVPQVGIVSIGDNVEIGAHTCIDRATLGVTSIGANTKIDNLVQIGHNATVGQHCIICGGAALGGSCRLGNQVVVGGSVAIADHLVITDGVRIGGHSGVAGNIPQKGDYAGYPAISAQQWRRQAVALAKLPKLLSKLKELVKGADKQ